MYLTIACHVHYADLLREAQQIQPSDEYRLIQREGWRTSLRLPALARWLWLRLNRKRTGPKPAEAP